MRPAIFLLSPHWLKAQVIEYLEKTSGAKLSHNALDAMMSEVAALRVAGGLSPHRNGQRHIILSDELLSAFLELERTLL